MFESLFKLGRRIGLGLGLEFKIRIKHIFRFNVRIRSTRRVHFMVSTRIRPHVFVCAIALFSDRVGLCRVGLGFRVRVCLCPSYSAVIVLHLPFFSSKATSILFQETYVQQCIHVYCLCTSALVQRGALTYWGLG